MAQKEKLTDAKVKSFISGKKRYPVRDTLFPGLFVNVGPDARTFFYNGRVNGRAFNFKLGDASAISVDEARERAGAAKRLASDGVDPREAQRERSAQIEEDKLANTITTEMTFAWVSEQWVADKEQGGKRTIGTDIKSLNLNWLPALGAKPIGDVSTQDIMQVLNKIENRARKKTGKGYAARKNNYMLLNAIFKWSLSPIREWPDGETFKPYIQHSPMHPDMVAQAVELTTKAKDAGKRWYSDAELKALWNAGIQWNELACIRVLMLTGQRVSVISGLEWDEIDWERGVITIQAGKEKRSKADKPHIIPMSSTVIDIIRNIERPVGRVHVFPTGRGGDADLAVGTKIQAAIQKTTSIMDYTHKHIRSIVTSRMRVEPLSVKPWLIDVIQGRADQTVQSRHYDANDYLKEKRAELQRWDDLLLGISGGDGAVKGSTSITKLDDHRVPA
jgi:integrase